MRNPNVSGYGYGDGQYGDRVYGLKSLSVSTLPPTSTITQIPDTTTTETSTQSIQALVDSSPFSILSDSTSTALTNRFVTTATQISNTTTTEASTQSIQALVDSSPFSILSDSTSTESTELSVSTATQIPIGRITVVGFEYGDGLYGEGGYGVTSQSISTDRFGSTVTQIPDTTTTESVAQSVQPAVNSSQSTAVIDSISTGSIIQPSSVISLNTVTISSAAIAEPRSLLSNLVTIIATNTNTNTTTQTTPVLDTASVIAVDSAINTVSDVPPIKSVVTLGDVDLTTTTTASIQSVRSSVSSSAFDIEITILLAQDPSRDINSTPTVEYADTDTDAVIYTMEHTNTYE